MRRTIKPSQEKSEWAKRFAFWPTTMTDGDTIVWLEYYEVCWRQKYETAGNRQWLSRAVGSGQEYPVKLIKPTWKGSAVF